MRISSFFPRYQTEPGNAEREATPPVKKVQDVNLKSINITMVSSNIRFSDIPNHWAKIFIDGLVERAVIRGFADRTFRPNINLTPMLYSGSQKSEVCPMPYAHGDLCPVVPHMRARKAIFEILDLRLGMTDAIKVWSLATVAFFFFMGITLPNFPLAKMNATASGPFFPLPSFFILTNYS